MRRIITAAAMVLTAALAWSTPPPSSLRMPLATAAAEQPAIVRQPGVEYPRGAKLLKPYRTVSGTSVVGRTPRLTHPETAMHAPGAAPVEFAAHVCFSYNFDLRATYPRRGMWRMNSYGDFLEQLSQNADEYLEECRYGAVVVEDTYYAMRLLEYEGTHCWIYAYDMADNFRQLSMIEVDPTSIAQAVVNVDGTVYGVFYGTGAQYTYGSIDMRTGTVTPISQVDWMWDAAAVAADGTVYAIRCDENTWDASLYTVDVATGVATLVGPLGIKNLYLTGAVIEPLSNRMFYAAAPEEETGNLYEVNLATGEATLIKEFEYADELVGMYIPYRAGGAEPGDPLNMAVSYPEGATAGNITFDIPTVTQSGTPLRGSVTYTLNADEHSVATGSAAAGESVTVPWTVPQPDRNYTFILSLSNEIGRSNYVKQTVYVGNDTPVAPGNVVSGWQQGTFTVTWDAVTQGVNGGYVDAAAVTYRVVRQPGDNVIAESTAQTSVTDAVVKTDTYTNYIYEVTAQYAGKSSAVGASNAVGLGNEIVPPYSVVFNTESSYGDFVIINSNGDASQLYDGPNTWRFGYITADAAYGLLVDYNSYEEADDWLITPSLKLTAGKAYRFSMVMGKASNYEERVEVKFGTQPTAAAMTETVIPPTPYRSTAFTTLAGWIIPPADGTYYVGVHAISEADKMAVVIHSLDIGGALPATLPQAPASLAVTPAPLGVTSATISATLPALDIMGNATTLTRAELMRNGTVIHTVDNPGETLEYTDNVEVWNTYTYTLVTYNATGASEPVTATAYIGLYEPGAPTAVEASAISDTEVTISWQPPTADAVGGDIDATTLLYDVVDATTGALLASNLPADTRQYTAMPLREGETGRMFAATVFAHNDKGYSAGAATPTIEVGVQTLPIYESFHGGVMHYPLGNERVSGTAACQWALFANTTAIPDTDGSGYSLRANVGAKGAASVLYTLPIDMSTMSKPVLRFAIFNHGTPNRTTGVIASPPKNLLNVVYREPGQTEWTNLTEPTPINTLFTDPAAAGWTDLKYTLEALVGKKVQVGLRMERDNNAYLYVDRIQLQEEFDNNLALISFSVPSTAGADEEFALTVGVVNRGLADVDHGDWKVEILKEGTDAIVAELPGTPVAEEATVLLTATSRFSITDEGTHGYMARLVWEADENANDNVTPYLHTEVVHSSKPAPAGLQAIRWDDSALPILTWEVPDLTGLYAPSDAVTDDMEAYAPWEYFQAGDWLMVDNDGIPTLGFNGILLPGLTSGASVTSFFTFSNAGLESYEYFTPHSGSNMLASFYIYSTTQPKSDWLISPLLAGGSQTVRLWARSLSNDATDIEQLEVMYSTGSESVDDFRPVEGGDFDAIPGEWTEIAVTLPRNAARFAIHANSTNRFVLFVDDITYTPADPERPVKIRGYNVYRNDVRLNTIPVPEPIYYDNEGYSGTPSYYVTAVYETGEESVPSNTAFTTHQDTPNEGGQSALDTLSGDLSITGGRGTLTVSGADARTVVVADMIGHVYHAGSGDVTLTLPAGVYLVAVDGHPVKVAVR